MKKIIFIVAILTFSLSVFSQESPVAWQVSQNRVVDGSRNIIITANINPNWYIYGMNMGEGGPLPLLLSFENQGSNVVWANFTEVTPATSMYDEVFSMNVTSYTLQAEFKCNYVPKADVTSLTLIIDGQACNKITGICAQVSQSIPILIQE
jgi:hypothetical protein